MKKTLIALAVAVAATSANATVVYQKDGTKIDIDGRLHFELINEKNNRTDLRDAGSRLRVRAYQEIGAGFDAFGGVEMRFTSHGTVGDGIKTHRLFAGVMHKDIGSLTFGRQLHLGDHIPKANPTYEWGGNIFFDSHTKAAHFMSAKFAGVRVAADYYFGDSNKQKADKSYKAKNDQGYGFGAFYDGQWGKFSVNLGAGYTEVKNSDGTRENQYKLKRGGIGSKFTYDIVSVGFDWAFAKASDGKEAGMGFQKVSGTPAGAKYNKNDRFLASVKVNVTPQNAVYTAYYFGTAKKVNGDQHKMRGWMLGADHRFNKHVAVYVEGGKGRVKHDGNTLVKNTRVLVGARVMF